MNLSSFALPSERVQAAQAALCIIVGLSFDAQGFMYIPEAFYGAVLRVGLDGIITRIAGSHRNNNLGDGGSPLFANLESGAYYSPASVAFDPSGNMWLPQSGANRIREVVPGALAVQLSQARVDFKGNAVQAQSVQVVTNVAEPFPFAIRVAGNNVAWLSANRVTGQTGDALVLSANPNGLGPGIYSATVQISVPGTTAAVATLPVTLTVQ